MTEHVRQKKLLTPNRTLRAWTVTFDASDVSPDGKREDLARNMVAGVAVGGERVRNDFDQVPIYQRPIFNATWDPAAGRWVDFVEMGEEGFTLSPTEENREVVYRCQPFWYKLGFEEGYGPYYVSVTDRPLEGYRLAPMFRDGSTFEYRPAFELALGTDGLPHSRAGLMPFEGSPTELMEKVFSYDDASRTETMADWFSDYLLLLVEFATRNLQGVMRGVAQGPLSVDIFWDEEEDPDVAPGIYTVSPESFEEGKLYSFVYTDNGVRVRREVELLSIGEYDDEVGSALYFDFEDQDEFVMAHYSAQVFDPPKKTGEALSRVLASSGRADADPYSACVWRGKENPWGNFSSFMSDVLIEAMGKQGMFTLHSLQDLRRFDGTLHDGYVKRAHQNKTVFKGTTGYVVAFATAGEEPWLIPGDCNTQNPSYHFATLYTAMPNNASKGVRYLRVGGDYTKGTAVNHATYEIYSDTVSYPKFGGRLILREGL